MKEIKLLNNYVALVDDEDYEELNQYKWYAITSKRANTFYAARNHWCFIKKKRSTVLMHRSILKVSALYNVDHADNNGLNNTKSNLRIVTQQENNMNTAPQKNNTIGYKGVYSDGKNKFVARISMNYKNIHIGIFEDKETAAKVYDSVVRFHYPNTGYTNFKEIYLEPISITDARRKYKSDVVGSEGFKISVYNKDNNEFLGELTVRETSEKYKIKQSSIYFALKSKNNIVKNLKVIRNYA